MSELPLYVPHSLDSAAGFQQDGPSSSSSLLSSLDLSERKVYEP